MSDCAVVLDVGEQGHGFIDIMYWITWVSWRFDVSPRHSSASIEYLVQRFDIGARGEFLCYFASELPPLLCGFTLWLKKK